MPRTRFHVEALCLAALFLSGLALAIPANPLVVPDTGNNRVLIYYSRQPTTPPPMWCLARAPLAQASRARPQPT